MKRLWWLLPLLFTSGVWAAPNITDVDSDESITATQTNVVVTGTGFDTAVLTLEQGAAIVTQSIDSQNATTVQVDVVFDAGGGPHLKYGAATLRATNGDASNDTQAVTITAPSGKASVNVGTPNADPDVRLEAVPDAASGDQIEISNVQGTGVSIADVTVNADLTWNADDAVASFDVRVWSADSLSWGAIGTQTIVLPVPPVFAGTIDDEAFEEDTGSFFIDASTYFTGATSYTLANAVTGIAINTSTGLITIDTATAAVGVYTTLSVTGINTDGSDTSNTFTVEIEAAAIAPVLVGTISNVQYLLDDGDKTISTAAVWTGETSFSIDALPTGFTFNTGTGVLSIDTDVTAAGRYSFVVSAINAGGSTPAPSFTVTLAVPIGIVQTITEYGYELRVSSDQARTCYGVALSTVAAEPDEEQIMAGTDGDDLAALSADSAAVTADAPGDLLLGVTLPKTNVYTVCWDGMDYTSIVELLGIRKAAPGTRQYVEVAL